MDWNFERVAGPLDFTEGPVWMGDHLLFTDIPNSRIMRYDPATGSCDTFRTGTNRANGLTLGRDGALLACEGGATSFPGEADPEALAGRRVVAYTPGEETTVLADLWDGKRLNSPNDVVEDAAGRIWFTDPRYGGREDMELDHESVYRLDPDSDGYTITRVTFDTTRPNGLLVNPDTTRLYVAQSDVGDGVARELRCYPIEDDGNVGDYEVPHNFYPHRGVDGMRFDSNGNIVAAAGWTQSGPGPMIYVFSPEGRVLDTNPIEADPTNCCFGDGDLQSLYVTTSDGSLYKARTDLKGLPVGNA